MTSKMQTGLDGESLAAEYLIGKGYEILERNCRYGRGEVDLIVRKGNWLIFVEVKTRSTKAFGFPEEFVDKEKEESVFCVAEWYMEKISWEGNVRYDIVAVLGVGWEREVSHFEDAFY
jgi:putative endonuclease